MKLNTSRYNAARIVQTESAAISAAAQEKAFVALDVEEFEVIETLDGHTCEICGSMDGKHFPRSEYEIGVTVPPFHPNCRGCTCPYFADDEGQRIARDVKTGETYYLPADTTYEQWKQMQDEKHRAGTAVITQKPVVQSNVGQANTNTIGFISVPSQSQTSEYTDEIIVKPGQLADITAEYIKKATPGVGAVVFDDGYSIGGHQEEIRIANLLHNSLGGSIRLLKEGRTQNEKNPDYEWNGLFWELKSLSTEKAADSAVRSAVKQIKNNPGGIVLEITDTMDLDKLMDCVFSRIRRSDISMIDFVIAKASEVLKVYRYKK